jgi:hypothetical protein
VTSRSTQEGLQLLGGPRVLFDLGDRARLGRVGDERDVAGDQAAELCIGECATNDQRHLVHGLGSQPGVAVGRVEHLVIEALQVMRSETPQPDATQRRKNVKFGLTEVAPVGGQGELLARQPLVGQVGTEAERAALIVTPVAFSSELGGQLLGLVSVGAGRVPRPPPSSRDGIQALIDDGVVAVAFTSDISLHGVLLSRAPAPCDPGRTTGRPHPLRRALRDLLAGWAGQPGTTSRTNPVEPALLGLGCWGASMRRGTVGADKYPAPWCPLAGVALGAPSTDLRPGVIAVICCSFRRGRAAR